MKPAVPSDQICEKKLFFMFQNVFSSSSGIDNDASYVKMTF